MSAPQFHLKLGELVEQAGSPNFVFYAYVDENGKFQLSYALHKVTTNAAVQMMLPVLAGLIDKKS